MKKGIIEVGQYTFDASAKTITLTGYVSFDQEYLILITNVIDGIIIYNFADPFANGVFAGNVLTLDYDTTLMSDSDRLQILIWEPDSVSGGGLTDAELRATPVDVNIAGGSVVISSEVEINNDSGNPIPVSVASLPLPTGAATEVTINSINNRIGYISYAEVDGQEEFVGIGGMDISANEAHMLQMFSLTNSKPAIIAIVDGNGDQITSFGGGSQYPDGDPETNPIGTVPSWVETGAGIHATSDAWPLPVTPLGVDFATEDTLTNIEEYALNTYNTLSQLSLPEDYTSLTGSPRGIGALAVRQDTPSNTSDTDGDFEFLRMSAGRLWTSSKIDTALPAGTNAIGKLAANSGVDIGDVDITSIAAGNNIIGQVKLTDGTDVALITAAGEQNVIATAQPGVDIGDVTINNAGAGSAVNIQDGGNSITIDAPTGTPVNVQIGDGTRQATVRDTGASDSLNVAIVDASGNQITTFGGGTQYADAAPVVGPTGTVIMYEDEGSGVVRAVSDTDPLPIVLMGISGSADVATETTLAAINTNGVKLTDGSLQATIRNTGSNDSLNVAIVDASGNQITTFGGGTEYTEGDVDASITGGAILMEVGGNTLQPVQGTVADGLLVNLGANNDVTVTNAAAANLKAEVVGTGTFVTQIDGAALTSLQLIDDTILADNIGFTDGATKVTMAGFIYDEVAGTALTENDAAAARINVNRAVVNVIEDGVTRGRYVTVSAANALKVDGSGVNQPVTLAAGAASIGKAEDVAAGDGDVGTPAMAVRKSTPANSSNADGDYEFLQMNGGALWTSPLGFFVSVSTDVVLPTSSIYAINDALSDSTSTPTTGGFTFTNAARKSGGSGIITDAIITTSADVVTLLQGEIWIFNAAVTAINDNAVFAVSDAEIKTCIGKIPFTLEDAGNNGFYHAQNLSIGFTCSGTANLRFLIKAKNAYTPATDTLTFVLKILQID